MRTKDKMEKKMNNVYDLKLNIIYFDGKMLVINKNNMYITQIYIYKTPDAFIAFSSLN